jgi:cytochrome c
MEVSANVLVRGGFIVLSVLISGNSFAAGDARRGATVFQACMACHSVESGEHRTGPSLSHVWGHKAGTAEGFARYSDAMKQAKIVWDDRTLDQWRAIRRNLFPTTT